MLRDVEADPEVGTALEGADDAFLVARTRDGDLRAFTVLLQRYNQTLRRYVERLTRNAADTDDVLQETAVSAWRHLDSLKEPAKVRAWLIQIATRQALHTVTARTPHDELTEDLVTDGEVDRNADRLHVRRSLQSALDALPQQQAQCWILRELGGYSYTEIAERLTIPESTVRGSLAQARKSILAAMEGQR